MGEDIVNALAVDAADNIYIGGAFNDTVDFDPDGSNVANLVAAGSDDAFVWKLDKSGDYINAVAWGGNGEDECMGLAVDDTNVYASGSFFGNATFVDIGLTAITDGGFVLKMDTSLNIIWANDLAGPDSMAYADVYDIAVKNEYICLVGEFGDSVDVDPGSNEVWIVSDDTTGPSGFVLLFDTTGAINWVQSNSNTAYESVVFDPFGNVYVAGMYVSMSLDTMNPVFVIDGLLQQFDSNGNLLHSDKIGSTDTSNGGSGGFGWATDIDEIYAIDTDDSGHVYFAGSFMDTVDFDPDTSESLKISKGFNDLFVAKWAYQSSVPCDSAEWAIWAEHPDCEADTFCSGEIGLWIDGGNPPYSAYLVYEDSSYSDTLTHSGPGAAYFQFYECSGIYEGIITDANGCTYSKTVVIGALHSEIENGDTIILCHGDSVELEASFEACHDMLAYFPLDGNTNDYSDYQNHGTDSGGVTYVDDRHGNAYSAIDFDGHDGFLNILHDTHYELGSNDFTISYWALRKDSVNGSGSLGGNPSIYDNVFECSKFSVNSLFGFASEWAIGVGNGLNGSVLNKPSFLIESNTANYNVTGTTHLPEYINTWTFMTGVRDDDSLRVYFNGVLEGSIYIGSDAVANHSLPLRLAWFDDQVAPGDTVSNVNSNVVIDDFTIYQCALQPEEVMELYHNGSLVDVQTHYWSAGDVNNVVDSNGYILVSPDSTTTYYYVVGDTAKTCMDSITVLVTGQQAFDIGPDTISDCNVKQYLDAGPGYSTYDWSTGDTTQNIAASATGEYWVEVFDTVNNCTATDTVYVSLVNGNIENGDTTICDGDDITLQVVGVNAIVPDNGMVAYYPFNGNTDDESGNGYHGTVVADNGGMPSLNTDRYGNLNSAYYFNHGGGIQLPHEVMDSMGDFTVSIWVKTSADEEGIISGANAAQANEFLVFNRISFPFVAIKGPSLPLNRYSDNLWHHLVISRTNSTGEMNVYIDGELDSYGTLDTGLLQIDPNGFWLGREQDQVGGGFVPEEEYTGFLDDVAFYDFAMDSIEAKGLFTAEYQYAWSTGDSTSSIDIAPTTTTLYWVTVIDEYGTECRDTVTVTVGSSPQVDLLGGQSTYSECDLSSVLIDAGAGAYSYDWSTGESTQTIVADHSGDYTVTVTDIVSNCTAQDNVYVSFLSVEAEENVAICSGDSVTLSVSSVNNVVADIDGNIYETVVIGTQEWFAENLKTSRYDDGTPINYPGALNPIWAADTVGSYAWYNNDSSSYNSTYGKLYNWYAVDNSAGLCPSGWHVPSVAEFETLKDYLGGASVAGGEMKEVGTAHWNSPNTGATNSSGFTALAGGLRQVNGNYDFMGEDADFWASGSSSNLIYLVYYNAEFSYGPVSKSLGHSVRCVRNATTNYLWNTGDTTASITVSPDSITSYSVTVSDGLGGTCEDSVTVNFSSLSTSIDNASCYASTDGGIFFTMVNGSGNYGYTLYGANDTALSAGNYTYSFTDTTMGCTFTDSFTISEPAQIMVYATTEEADCNQSTGSAVVDSVHNDVNGYSLQWSSGDTTSIADTLSSGIYMVSATDGNGCIGFTSVMINDNGAPTFNTTSIQDVSCNGSSDGSISIGMIGGASPYIYSWSNGDSTSSISNLSVGPYEVVVTDTSGCTVSQSFVVNEPAPISLMDSAHVSACGASNGFACVMVFGGTLPYTYNWSSGSSSSTSTSLVAGIYGITVTDANGCSDSSNVSVSEDGGASIVIGAFSSPGCGSSSGSINITPTGGTQPYTYLWSTNDTTQDISGLPNGQYDVTVTGNDGCMGVYSTTLLTELPTIPSICLVTVDQLSGTNTIVWEKDNPNVTTSYNLYKESTFAGVYQLIANIPIADSSFYVDHVSNPQIRSWRYKLTALDSCGNESGMSVEHKTIHLTINLGIGGAINLIWDHYEGITVNTYDVHRYYPSTGWDTLASLTGSLTSYTDTPSTLTDLFYQITVDHPDGCFPGKMGGDHHSSRSNTSSIGNNPFGFPPMANFMGSMTVLNTGGLVDFLDLSQQNPDSWTWLFDGGTPPFSTQQHPTGIAYNTVGIFDVTLVVTNSFGVDTLVKTNYIEVVSGVGVAEENPMNNLHIYPNPFTENTTLVFANIDSKNHSLFVFDVLGNQLVRVDGITTHEYVFSKGDLPPGVYFVELLGEGVRFHGRMLIE